MKRMILATALAVVLTSPAQAVIKSVPFIENSRIEFLGYVPPHVYEQIQKTRRLIEQYNGGISVQPEETTETDRYTGDAYGRDERRGYRHEGKLNPAAESLDRVREPVSVYGDPTMERHFVPLTKERHPYTRHPRKEGVWSPRIEPGASIAVTPRDQHAASRIFQLR